MTNYETYLFYIYPDEDCTKGYMGNIYQCMAYFLRCYYKKRLPQILLVLLQVFEDKGTFEDKKTFNETEKKLLLDFYEANFWYGEYEGWFLKEAEESFYYLLDDDEIMKIGEELESDGELELRNYAVPADILRPYVDSVAIRYSLTDDQKNQLRNQI